MNNKATSLGEKIQHYIDIQKKGEIKWVIDRCTELLDGHNPFELYIVQVGSQGPSNRYVQNKIKDCNEVGINVNLIQLSETISFERAEQIVKDCQGPTIVQLPLPLHLSTLPDCISFHWSDCFSSSWDVDGLQTNSKYIPCTPKGIIDFLTYSEIPIKGQHALVIGRSNLVGRPMFQELESLGATVTLAHSHTPDKLLYELAAQADIIVCAVGKHGILAGEKVLNRPVKPQIIIDVGINFTNEGRLVGDVAQSYYSLLPAATQYSPVPGGVGLLTRLALLHNVVIATIRTLNDEGYNRIQSKAQTDLHLHFTVKNVFGIDLHKGGREVDYD